jgi:phosphomannomutase
LAIIDENGVCLSEEVTLALAVKQVLKSHRGPVAINMSTSRMIEDIARAAGCECHRAAVGEANVVEKMRAVNAVIGGEGNGGVIDPRVGWIRDPFIGIARILSLMAEERKPLSAMIAELPNYQIVKRKISISQSALSGVKERLKTHWPSAKVNLEDGIRIDLPEGWLHVRGSNTEPVVRVIAEAQTTTAAERLCDCAEVLMR